ncbi:cold-shock protein [Rhizobium lentis]|nr:cold-shock protein [Rhizobium lentis]
MFNSTNELGFIQPDNGGPDAFVHISAVERAGMREIVKGQKNGYDLEHDDKSGKMSVWQSSVCLKGYRRVDGGPSRTAPGIFSTTQLTSFAYAEPETAREATLSGK